MINTTLRKLLFIIIPLLAWSCQEDTFDPETSFTKIYDNNRGGDGYYPIDMVASTSGYVILAGVENNDSDFLGAKVIHIDLEGNFLMERDLSNDLVAPLGDLVSIDSIAYFLAMDPVSLNAVLVSVDDTAAYSTTTVTGISHPLAASTTVSGNLLVLSYDVDDQQSVVTEVTLQGSIVSGRGYTIGAGNDIEENIFNHYTDPERSAMPFYCGEWSPGQFYFNGVYNYNLSLVFTDFGDTPNGVVQGQGLKGGFSKVLPLQGSDFTLFGFQYNDNFVVPVATLNTSGITSSVNYLETTISEFRSRTPARIIQWQDDQNYTIVAAETHAQRIALYFYESATGTLLGIHKLGYINPYSLSSLMIDADGNLLVLGTTYVSGRFKRVFVSKIANEELRGLVH